MFERINNFQQSDYFSQILLNCNIQLNLVSRNTVNTNTIQSPSKPGGTVLVNTNSGYGERILTVPWCSYQRDYTACFNFTSILSLFSKLFLKYAELRKMSFYAKIS